MKKPLITVLFVVVAVGVLAAAIALGNKLLVAHSDATALCKVTGSTHVVTVKNNTMVPATVTAPRCDKLVIKNLDPITREIGFGEHDHHVAYDGIAEKVLRQGGSVTVTLVKTGTFHFHDHFHDEVAGSFTVTY